MAGNSLEAEKKMMIVIYAIHLWILSIVVCLVIAQNCNTLLTYSYYLTLTMLFLASYFFVNFDRHKSKQSFLVMTAVIFYFICGLTKVCLLTSDLLDNFKYMSMWDLFFTICLIITPIFIDRRII